MLKASAGDILFAKITNYKLTLHNRWGAISFALLWLHPNKPGFPPPIVLHRARCA